MSYPILVLSTRDDAAVGMYTWIHAHNNTTGRHRSWEIQWLVVTDDISVQNTKIV